MSRSIRRPGSRKAASKTTSEHFGAYLKERREVAGLSQAQVAESLGYSSPQFISNWERNLARPPMKALQSLAKLYTVPRDDIFAALLTAVLTETEADLHEKFYGSKKSR